MSMMDFVMELLFTLFVVLLSFVGLLFIGALFAGVFFVLCAFTGWVMTLVQERDLGGN